ncbi:MAG TPA: pitrilysin family protein [Gemmatimonadota bacterium]|nr:pitrilysin family protein [Gemmatimonadota bacterium]
MSGSAPDRSSPPPSAELRAVELPELEAFRLDNGLRVLVGEDHRLPEVSLRLIVEAGASADPAGHEGAAELTGRLLTEGAAGRGAQEVAAWLDRLGASFSVSAGYDVTILSLHLLSDVLDGGLDVLRAVAREPSFAEAEVDRVRQERLDEIDRDRDKPEVAADHTLIRAVFGDHRYGTPSAGLRESVEGLGREEVASFHGGRYGPPGAALVACGDVDPGVLLEAVEERFGSWEGGRGRAVPPQPAPPAGPGPRVLLVDRPDSAQAELRLGTVGAAYGDETFFALLVGNAILGGLFNSRINMNLREEKGWTYGARTSFHFRRVAGPFVGRTAVETAAAADALAEFVREMEGMVGHPPTNEEMTLARNSLVLSLPRQFETVSQVTRKITTQVVYGLPRAYWERYRERIEGVTRDDVVRAMGRFMEPEALRLVVVGRAAELEGRLAERFDRVEVVGPPGQRLA